MRFWKTKVVSIFFLAMAAFSVSSAHASLTGGSLQLNSQTSQPSITLWAGNVQGMDVPIISRLSDGSDGILSPTKDQILRIGSDGIFNFSTITIPSGVSLDVLRNGYEGAIYLLATGDISIDGLLREVYGPLIISTTGGIYITGAVESSLLSLSANRINISGAIITSTIAPVPLPGALWLLGSALGTLWLGRKAKRGY